MTNLSLAAFAATAPGAAIRAAWHRRAWLEQRPSLGTDAAVLAAQTVALEVQKIRDRHAWASANSPAYQRWHALFCERLRAALQREGWR